MTEFHIKVDISIIIIILYSSCKTLYGIMNSTCLFIWLFPAKKPQNFKVVHKHTCIPFFFSRYDAVYSFINGTCHREYTKLTLYLENALKKQPFITQSSFVFHTLVLRLYQLSLHGHRARRSAKVAKVLAFASFDLKQI